MTQVADALYDLKRLTAEQVTNLIPESVLTNWTSAPCCTSNIVVSNQQYEQRYPNQPQSFGCPCPLIMALLAMGTTPKSRRVVYSTKMATTPLCFSTSGWKLGLEDAMLVVGAAMRLTTAGKAQGPKQCRRLPWITRIAGVVPTTTPPHRQCQLGPVSRTPIQLEESVLALTADRHARLADWRGYSPKFIEWLQAQHLVGLFDGDRIAFLFIVPRGTWLAAIIDEWRTGLGNTTLPEP